MKAITTEEAIERLRKGKPVYRYCISDDTYAKVISIENDTLRVKIYSNHTYQIDQDTIPFAANDSGDSKVLFKYKPKH